MNNSNEPRPIEPSIMGRLNETLGYIGTLERHFADLDGSIFGRAENSAKRDTPSTFEGMMADACERAANLCGWIGTIKNGLGCPDSVNAIQSNVPSTVPVGRR